MLGRKQSLKGELILADYGPEESLNENADDEFVDKVSTFSNYQSQKNQNNFRCRYSIAILFPNFSYG